jgi:formate dehydrogenase subunit gamma
MNSRNADRIVRYTAGTRINHWIVAISFVLLALSGLALFHPALFWLTNLFGGGPWTRILHPFIGCVMVAAFYLFCVQFWRDNWAWKHHRAWLREVGKGVQSK